MNDGHSSTVKIEDIELGGIDAEADYNLSTHFVKTHYASTLFSKRNECILGRKGSGKTALFTQMPSLAPKGFIVSTKTPGNIWETLRKQEDTGIPNRDAAFVSAWTYVLSLLVAQAIVDSKVSFHEETRTSLLPVRRFLEENFPTGASPIQAARSFIKRIRSMSLSAFGVGAGITWDADETSEAASFVVEKIMDAISPAINEAGLVLALDQVDEGWDAGPVSRAMMIGLLRASKRLNDKYGFRGAGKNHLRIMVFIRSDIYDSLAFDEKDKHRPLELQISWDKTTLESMVNARLPEPLKVGDILSGGVRGDADPFNYIVSRTFMRPREVLQFLGEAQSAAGSNATKIDGAALREAEARYSLWKVEDLKQEYSKSDPTLSILLECLRQGIHRYDSIEQLETLLKKKAPTLLDPPGITSRSLIDRLFNYSIIGVRVGNSGTARYRAEEPQLALPSKGMVYVHPSLHKGLLIKEARKPRA